MNVSLKSLARLALLGAVLAGSAPAMAHRSGCHLLAQLPLGHRQLCVRRHGPQQ